MKASKKGRKKRHGGLWGVVNAPNRQYNSRQLAITGFTQMYTNQRLLFSYHRPTTTRQLVTTLYSLYY